MSPINNEHYELLKNSICELYPEGLSNEEAEEATRNLIGFTKLLLEIKRRVAIESEDV